VNKPVLNAFRMLGLLGNQRLKVTSSAVLPSDEIVRSGVRGRSNLNAIAARKEREVEVLVWNYHDDDVAFPASSIDLMITNLPPEAKRPLIEHFVSIPTTAMGQRLAISGITGVSFCQSDRAGTKCWSTPTSDFASVG
jgi:hypothetical protein